MLFNPILKLSQMIITFIIRRSKLPSLFIGISTQLFIAAKNLFRSQGYFTTLFVLNRINREIQNRGNLQNIINYPGLNPIVVSMLTSILLPNWNYCLQYSDKINKYYKWYVFGMIISNFNNLIFKIIKLCVGLIFSSLGIIYSDFFASYSALKDLSINFLSLIEKYTNIRFYLSFSEENLLKNDENETININKLEDPNKISIFSVIGYLLTGILLFLLISIGIDVYIPHVFDNIPVLQPIIDSVHIIYTSIYDFIRSFYGTDIDPGKIEPENKPEGIKRSLSGESTTSNSSNDSDRTIKPNSPEIPNPSFDPWN